MIEDTIRKHLRSFVPYTSARSEVLEGELLLDANELSIGSAVSLEGIPLNRYPDPNQVELRTRLATTLGASPETVFVGSGSDEIIDLLIRLLCEPGHDRAAILEPTYGVYRVAASISRVDVDSIELGPDFQLEVNKTLGSLKPTTKVVFLCSPNNPTGNLLKKEDILDFCEKTSAIVVVDQAYVEFADQAGDIAREVPKFPNLVVLRTLSKAWGLAGIRLGYCVADPVITSYLLRIKAPYNINAVTSKLALDALADNTFVSMATHTVRRERARMEGELKSMSCVKSIYPSDANFLLVEFADAAGVYAQLVTKGIVVRRRSEPRLMNCLRITIGTADENERVLNALRECR